METIREMSLGRVENARVQESGRNVHHGHHQLVPSGQALDHSSAVDFDVHFTVGKFKSIRLTSFII